MSIVLNQNQEKIVNAAVNWFLNSSSLLFQFDGEAGTGKSVVLNEILKRLHLNIYEYAPMAYTGQATMVMRTKGLTTARTCHSTLFYPDEEVIFGEDGKPVIDTQFNIPKKRIVFKPYDFSGSLIKLFIIDEAWMVPKRFRKFIEDTGIKVIAAGDSGQLPPIKDEPAYLVDGPIYHLTELMRQSETSPLVYIAHRAREGKPIELGRYGNDVVVLSKDEFNMNLLRKSEMTLCPTNRTRDYINSFYRDQILHLESKIPVVGERVICRKNNWKKIVNDIPLVNGLIGTVTLPPGPEPLRKDGSFTMDFLPDLFPAPFNKLRVNYKYFISNNETKNLLKNTPFLKGELFEFAYASTVHLAQGSEYSQGIYFEERSIPSIMNNLNYTAITRFKHRLIYVKDNQKRYW